MKVIGILRMSLNKHPRSHKKVYLLFVFLICFYPHTAKCEDYPTTPRGVVEQYIKDGLCG
jgi:hypothetical protein